MSRSKRRVETSSLHLSLGPLNVSPFTALYQHVCTSPVYLSAGSSVVLDGHCGGRVSARDFFWLPATALLFDVDGALVMRSPEVDGMEPRDTPNRPRFCWGIWPHFGNSSMVGLWASLRGSQLTS